MATFFELSLDSLQVGDTFTMGRGAKQIPLTVEGKPVVWQPHEWLINHWEPSAFENPEATPLPRQSRL